MGRIYRVDFYPYSSGLNPYIDIMKNTLKSYKDISIEEFHYSEFYYLKNRKIVDVVYLNWYENVQTDSFLRTLIRIARRLFMLSVIKCCNIKCIVVIHNRVPHNAKNVSLIQKYMKCLYMKADKLVILSDGTRTVLSEDFGEKYYEKVEDKIIKIPHPNYFGIYKNTHINYRSKWGIDEDDFVYLFYGNIAPYKNVEIAVDAISHILENNKDVKFVIMGGCSKEYSKQLFQKTKGMDNLLLIPGEISENELTSVIMSSNVVVMPFNKKSSINSASIILALSCGVNVICPDIPGALEFGQEMYLYSYENTEQHKKKLMETSLDALNEYKNNRMKFNQRLERIGYMLKENNNNIVIGELLSKEIKYYRN